MAVRLADRIARPIWPACYEREVAMIMEESLIPRMVLVDVGAQIGYFTAPAMISVGKIEGVGALEADPECLLLIPFHPVLSIDYFFTNIAVALKQTTTVIIINILFTSYIELACLL